LSIVNALSTARPGKGAQAPGHVEEREEEGPPQDEGWLEVGKRNRTVVTRTVSSHLTFFTKYLHGCGR
jgi:ubiquitin carboxyl-terminal hydrolase 10